MILSRAQFVLVTSLIIRFSLHTKRKSIACRNPYSGCIELMRNVNCVLSDVGVLWRDVVSVCVCCDGVSAMAGEFTGVQARC